MSNIGVNCTPILLRIAQNRINYFLKDIANPVLWEHQDYKGDPPASPA